jgi:hypothetical protein
MWLFRSHQQLVEKPHAETQTVRVPPAPKNQAGSVATASMSQSGEPGSPGRLVRLYGLQDVETWLLPRNRPSLLGRGSRSYMLPDIDLYPDLRVSRTHARIWCQDDIWWIEDLQSRNSTFVGNRKIQGQGSVRIQPWVDIQLGKTVLMLAPPHWYRLRSTHFVVDFEVSAVMNLTLAHCGTPLIRRLVARNWQARPSPPQTLQVVFPGFASPENIEVPSIAPGQSLSIAVPPLRFNYEALEQHAEKSLVYLNIALGDSLSQRAAIWVLEANT